MKVQYHPAAVAEARAARLWYEEQSPGLGDEFVNELDGAVQWIAERPDAWPRFEAGTRRYLMKRFPYFVVYRTVEARVLEVVAVMHAKRKPGYWRRR